ncbi:hypothetical protein FHK87_21265 [Aquimarina algicola]|uniref:Uncharacterized protein n=2 Tax=Aquimarina algicola TaxID=2589995 RepID=A0A504J4W9_9FLAO|nr:hypothetical protein FHK87_21265 [Aquimarina algicola]
MEYLDVFYHIFREDMPLLVAEFLPREKYRIFLESYHPYLFTHYTCCFKKENKDKYSLLKITETPFYKYETIKAKPGFIKTNHKQMDQSFFNFLTETISIDTEGWKELYIKETEAYIFIDLFVSRNYSQLSDIELCYYYYFKTTQTAATEIRDHLHEVYFDESLSEKQRKIKIRKYQHKLIYYIAILEKTYLKKDIHTYSFIKEMPQVYKCIHTALDSLIIYMEECCSPYLDDTVSISYEQRIRFINTYYDRSKHLLHLFKAQRLPKDIEKELCKPLLKIQWDDLYPFSYKQRSYYRTYIDLFIRLLTKQETPNHDEIYRLLIALNFNTHNIGKAMSHELITRLDHFDTEQQKQVYLYKQLARVESVPVTAETRYRPEFPGLKGYIINFIRQQIEVSYQTLEIEQWNGKKASGSDIDVREVVDSKVVKRRVNLSIPEIALLGRLFSEIKVINIKDNKQQYFKFLSQIYTSRDNTDISEHSIKNAFYSSSDTTLENVERVLIRMLNTLQKLKASASR